MPDIPRDFAEKARDLESLRKSVEDAASIGSGLWLSYLFALYSIAFAAAGVTHRELLLDSAVRLPFLNVELPLVFFFVVAPGVFVVSHAYMLMHLVLLAKKVDLYDTQLSAQVTDPVAREELRRQLPSNIFIQFLAGPNDMRTGVFGSMLHVIITMSVVVGPIFLLLLLQVQFIPYHSGLITGLHRIMLLLDVILLWLLWPAMLERRSSFAWPRPWRNSFLACLSIMVVALAFVVVRAPSETWVGEKLWIPANRVTAALGFKDGEGNWLATSLYCLLFDGPINEPFLVRASPFSSTLVLPEWEDKETRNHQDGSHGIRLRGRDLEGALLNKSFLTGVDLTGAILDNASLRGAHLRGAAMTAARLEKAFLINADLQGTDLEGADLEGADLRGADLSDAVLCNATLRNADLRGAKLQRADLRGARLTGVRLEGRDLEQADISGANFDDAKPLGNVECSQPRTVASAAK